MNIDRVIPKSIRESKHAEEDMLDALETFADAVGGPAWQQRRARDTELTRRLTLYIDEEYETLDPEDRQPLRENDGEEIEISFSAERIPVEDPELFEYDFSNLYRISHSISFPLHGISDMPLKYQEELIATLREDDEDSSSAVENLNLDDLIITETNLTKYTVDQVDGAIGYEQYVDYSCGDILIKGAQYTGELDEVAIHDPERDTLSEEWLTAELGVDEDQAPSLEERILINEEIAALAGDERHRMELLARSSDDHAIRILGLLSLIGANIRRR
jgi:hypothetical protein